VRRGGELQFSHERRDEKRRKKKPLSFWKGGERGGGKPFFIERRHEKGRREEWCSVRRAWARRMKDYSRATLEKLSPYLSPRKSGLGGSHIVRQRKEGKAEGPYPIRATPETLTLSLSQRSKEKSEEGGRV